MPDTLVAFIEARLAEDEQLANDATQLGPWYLNGDDEVMERNGGLIATGRWGGVGAEGPHIVRHDPARVLREVQAKRRLLAEHQPLSPEPNDITGCSTCSWRDDWDELHVAYPCLTVRLLAAPFVDHPDFRAEWLTEEPTDA